MAVPRSEMDDFWEMEERHHKIARLGKCLLGGIQTLWTNSALLDYTIIVEDKSFKVHRVIMAAVSDFFRVMFEGSMQESREDSVELKGVTAAGLEPLLEYFYTEKPLGLTRENILDVLAAASHLQVTVVTETCMGFLEDAVDVDNCVDVLNLVFMYHLKSERVKLDQQAVDCLTENLDTVVEEGHFLRLSIEALRYVLSQGTLHQPEDYLLGLVKSWLDEDPVRRQSEVKQALSVIRLPLMTLGKLNELLKNRAFLGGDPACREIVEKALEYKKKPLYERVLNNTEWTSVRGEKLIVSLSGRLEPEQQFYPERRSSSMFIYQGNEWKPIAKGRTRAKCHVPTEFSFHHASVAVVNNFMVVCGGFKTSSVGLATSACHIFDPRSHKWGRLASMNFPRADFALVTYDNHVYALGGEVRNAEFTNAVERYNFAEDEWKVVTRMEQKLAALSAVVTENVILVSGGNYWDNSGNLKTSKDVQSYDPVTNKWHPHIPMKIAMAGHTMMELFGQKKPLWPIVWQPQKMVYIVPRSGQSIVTYDPVNFHWEKHKLHEKLPGGATVVAVDNKIYFINGKSAAVDGVRPCQERACVCYDPLVARNRWQYSSAEAQTEMTSYPEHVNRPLCCTLTFNAMDLH